MKTNFEIEDNYAVLLAGTHLDLHNNFDFQGLIKKGDDILIRFQKTKGDWLNAKVPDVLYFHCMNVSYQYYIEGDEQALKEDAIGLSDITFFPSESRMINDSLRLQSNPEDKDDLILFFQDGKVIRIGCTEIKLITEDLEPEK
ncbi:hypothetical protein [Croceimicrobium hydrocarbonivorans]|uniref:Uncharacterized protein n=1 Tax=Croceimicrobium hydrocarbonivorans TaxID=2761580 RepID=A0A7H0VC63_9FLAO|nr:hypothetical protein [Croceimicrobium hydrocarbonivorans]QNR23311.1 hypothetical protein H4K34_13115 [Croceimicrobium hydrocarbonivorans]